MANSNYIFYSTWWEMLRELDRETRDEVICAYNAYVFDGVEPTLSPQATGYFFAMRLEADKVRNRSEDISRKRSEAGKKGMNSRWHNKDNKNNNCYENVTKITNVTNSAIAIFDNKENEKEKNQKNKDKETTESSTTTARAKEEWLSWLSDDEERLQLLLLRSGLISQPSAINVLQDTIKPYVDEFVEGEFLKGSDLYTKDRKDVIYHFSLWLPSYIAKNKKNDNTGHVSAPVSTGSAVPEYYYDFDKRVGGFRNAQGGD